MQVQGAAELLREQRFEARRLSFRAAHRLVFLCLFVLEILKFRRFRERQLRRDATLSEAEIEDEIEREVETGEFDAIKMTRRNEGSGDVVEIWLAANRSYLPVRIVILEKDGTRYEHVVTRMSP